MTQRKGRPALTTRLDEEQIAELDRWADKADMDRSDFVRLKLRPWTGPSQAELAAQNGRDDDGD